MKCLPSSKITQIQGNVLHDWHAEVLAIRAFNCFVLDECRMLASNPKNSSAFVRRRSKVEGTPDLNANGSPHDGLIWHGQPFTWREDVLLHMYCSEAPCMSIHYDKKYIPMFYNLDHNQITYTSPHTGGDASMELTMASQTDATPWAIPPSNHTPNPIKEPDTNTLLLPGRAYFSQLGIVRRKPSRSDAPPTLSKSCSDKLALHQCTSLLSSPTSLLVSPENAYINTLILPESQYSVSGCRRAFSDGRTPNDDEGDKGVAVGQARMAPLAISDQENQDQQQFGGGYAFRPFKIKTTDLEFAFSRRSPTTTTTITPTTPGPNPTSHPNKITPSNLATAYTASGRSETTLNGVLQGRKASSADIRGASFASRRRTWGLAVEVAGFLELELLLQSEGGEEQQSSNNSNNTQIRVALGAVSASLHPDSPSLSPSAEESVKATVTYGDMKNHPLLESRRRIKDVTRRLALKGWVRNLGDEDLVL